MFRARPGNIAQRPDDPDRRHPARQGGVAGASLARSNPGLRLRLEKTAVAKYWPRSWTRWKGYADGHRLRDPDRSAHFRIGVAVKVGVVILTGWVDSLQKKWAAEEAALRVRGVPLSPRLRPGVEANHAPSSARPRQQYDCSTLG